MEYYVDVEGTQIRVGDKVQIVDRVYRHEDKNWSLVDKKRTGVVVDSTPKHYVLVKLHRINKGSEFCEPAYFYPQELKVLNSNLSDGKVLSYEPQKMIKESFVDDMDHSEGSEYIESETPHWVISKDQYTRLISYIGCGNFPKADILFFGNEEGTGTFSIEANVEARCSTFGKDAGSSAANYTFGNPDQNGYWESSAIGGRDKVVEYLRAKGENPVVTDNTRSSFLTSISRMVLALEKRDTVPLDHWFQSSNVDGIQKQIKEFALKELFCPRKGIQTALSDWRHLPRPKEGAWYEAYQLTDTIQAKYLRAYNQFADGVEDSFSNYSRDVEKRRRLLMNAFEQSSATILIGLGGANGFKKEVLSHMFGVSFEPVELEHGIMMNRAVAALTLKKMNIFLLPFPSAQVYGNMEKLMDCLKIFVGEYLSPLLERNVHHD